MQWWGRIILASLPGVIVPHGAASAQFLDHALIEPTTQAALALPPDQRAPSADETAQITALEQQVRLDQPCNTTWQSELEAPRRELLALYETTYGPQHPATVRPLLSLLCHVFYNDRSGSEYPQIADRLISIGQQRNQRLIVYAGLDARLTQAANTTGLAASMADAQARAALARELFGPESEQFADSRRTIGSVFQAQGKPAEADQYLLDYIAYRERNPPDYVFGLANLYESMGDHLIRQLRKEEADAWFDRAIAVYENALPHADDRQLSDIAVSAQQLYWHAPARIEALYRALLAQQEARPDSTDARNWMTLWNLSKAARLQGRREEAIALLSRVITATGPGPNNDRLLELASMLSERKGTAPMAEALYREALMSMPNNPALLENLAGSLTTQGRHEEALATGARGVALARAQLGPADRETLRLTLNHARQLWSNASMTRATPFYEQTLAGYRTELSALPASAAPAYRSGLRSWIGTVASELTRLYWLNRINLAPRDVPEQRDRAFEVVQLAHPSSSAEAISESAAQAIAVGRGQSAAFDAWSQARTALAALDADIAAATAKGTQGLDALAPLVDARPALLAATEREAASLRRVMPDILSVLRPEPVSRRELAGGSGRSALLRPDEALILLYPGYPAARGQISRGLVFAITRDASAWAEIPVDGADLTGAVERMRYQLGGDSLAGETASEGDDNPDGFLRFDRVQAHTLYQNLFGDPAVAAIISDKPRWVLVPQGPLLSLPFSALVTAPPAGGARGDIDPDQLRATAWLGLRKVITILPNVDALRTARTRSLRGAARPAGFFGLGDPAFRGVPDPESTHLPNAGGLADLAPLGPASRYFRSGAGDAESVGSLPRLALSGREVSAVAQILDAKPSQVLLQMDATQPQVIAANQAGQLSSSGIVVFATHALLAGELGASQVEPALALTPVAQADARSIDPGKDGLLTASEISLLDLRVAMVILSACNTGAGAEGGEGFSGLVRAFFQAGAGSVVATHLPLLNDIGERLTISMIGHLRDTDNDVAAALNLAMREVAMDPRFDAEGTSLAHPRNWAIHAVIDPQ